jgi:hypothetical protein
MYAQVAVKEKCEKIAQLLSECQRLQKWLQSLELSQYFPMFVNEVRRVCARRAVT